MKRLNDKMGTVWYKVWHAGIKRTFTSLFIWGGAGCSKMCPNCPGIKGCN